jgi:ribosomal protein S27AE
MTGDKYILDCPRCGKVEGFAPVEVEEEDRDLGPETADTTIEQEEFEQPGHLPTTRLRCPRCGTWVPADRATPAE